MKININKVWNTVKDITETSTGRKKCLYSETPIDIGLKCIMVASNAFRNKLNFRMVHPESVVVILYYLTGKKYLKKKICDEIEQQLIAEKV